MTKDEKTKIYNLLKAASDNLCGYFSPDFAGDVPEFSDDPEISNEKSASSNQASSQPELASDSTLSHINKKISECKRCGLCAGRRNVVPGMGVPNPFVLVIGEGPGEEEDKQGKPFVGPAGQLLDKMLGAIGLSRDKNCYIANIVKCRPPMNRNPLPEEADACRPFLDAQIAALKPKAILCAGSVAVKNLFHTNDGVMKLHGQVLDFKGIPVVTTWHPSALLRAPENKRPAWEDLKVFKNVLLGIEPDYCK
ncbi:uracil-DNA glycosylase [Treponema ruminis]|uniref:Type-4 uracil-DNA glycosylase n=1 Tax=Treponema ruminis TaxID=744515 RepID=A0A7W8G8T0_9SPIR|nr:uracil-DNA glycosylase [Treponema ruminis]MBB5225824.1 DNA polymerase [Treponema ruminis]QSI02513.1 uracil-DNA glycosylase [Treponema ruminis]